MDKKKFTLREATAAALVRDQIIDDNITELKSIYMAGEVNMWVEMSVQLDEKTALIGELVGALQKAADDIKQWHAADDVWQIYFEHAPEMKLIREAIFKCKQMKDESTDRKTG